MRRRKPKPQGRTPRATRNRKRAEKRRRKSKPGCSGKVRYQTPQEAQEAATGFLENPEINQRCYWVYLCQWGAHYHLTTHEGPSWTHRVEIEEAI